MTSLDASASSYAEERSLHLDLTHGLAGDMFLAALADAGLDLAPLAAIMAPLAVLAAPAETRRGLAGRRLDIVPVGDPPLRHLPEVLAALEGLALPATVKRRSAAAFRRLAEVEAAVHGVGVERIHFHEVGAVDTIVDVAGAFWALETLGATRCTASSAPWSTGTVTCAHGDLPLPAPATVRLLQGRPVHPAGPRGELITPTGALLLDQLPALHAEGPEGVLMASGLGYGSRPQGEGLRVFLTARPALRPGEERAEERAKERIWVLETNLDHLTGEELGVAIQEIMAAGALDVLYVPGVMKKNRPGGLLQALADEAGLAAVETAVFRQTCTLGLRLTPTWRKVAPRRACSQATPWGEVAAKRAVVAGETVVRPELDALRALAKTTGRTVTLLRLGGRDAEKP